MADQSPDTEPDLNTRGDTDAGRDRGSTTGTARWQKVVGVVGGVVVVLVAITLFTGGHGPARHAPSGEAPEPIRGAPEIEVEGVDLTFRPDEIILTASEPVNIVLTASDVEHDFVIDGVGFHLHADPGETATAGLMIHEPGEYLVYCSVPGHREAGMEATVIVETSSEEPGGHTPPGGGH